MDALWKVLVACGLFLVAAGLAVLIFSRFGIHRLPGDVVVRRPHLTLYVPVGLMILLSVVLTIVLNLVARKK